MVVGVSLIAKHKESYFVSVILNGQTSADKLCIRTFDKECMGKIGTWYKNHFTYRTVQFMLAHK